MADDVRRLSDELARDPGSRVFVPAGRGAAPAGPARSRAQGHDARARAASALPRRPRSPGAHRGGSAGSCSARSTSGTWCCASCPITTAHCGAWASSASSRAGCRKPSATSAPRSTQATPMRACRSPWPTCAPRDSRRLPPPPPRRRRSSTRGARSRLPPGTTHDPRFLFADVLTDAEQTALLLDADGLVLAGAYVAYDGRDVAQEVGAELSGVTRRRASRDAPPQAGRLDVDRVRDRGGGGRHGAVAGRRAARARDVAHDAARPRAPPARSLHRARAQVAGRARLMATALRPDARRAHPPARRDRGARGERARWHRRGLEPPDRPGRRPRRRAGGVALSQGAAVGARGGHGRRVVHAARGARRAASAPSAVAALVLVVVAESRGERRADARGAAEGDGRC